MKTPHGDVAPWIYQNRLRWLPGNINQTADLDLPYEMPESWFVKMGVARNWSTQNIADWLGRPERSVRHFIRDTNPDWRDLDRRLEAMNVTMDSDIFDVQFRLGVHTAENYRNIDEIRERALVLRERRSGEDSTWNSAYPGDAPPPQAGTARQSLAGPSSSSGQYYGAPRMAAYPTAYQDYPGPGQPLSQAGPADQNVAGPSSWPLALPGPLPYNRSRSLGQSDWRSQEQGGHVANDQEQIQNSAGPSIDGRQRAYLPWSAEEEEQAKIKWAGGLGFSQIAEELNTHRTPYAVQWKLLHFKDWKLWSKAQDKQVLELHKDERLDWAQISNLLPGTRRSEEEVKARVAYLIGVQDHGKGPRQRNALHEFHPREDREIELGAAAGKGLSEIARDVSPGISRKVIATRAKKLSALWTDEDDNLLRSQVEGHDMEVDWDSVGGAFNPPRAGEVVRTRWEYLNPRSRR